MIKHLKSNEYKGIKDIRLLNLGNINIVCGKNNSGKSSILESLVNGAKIGVYFEDTQPFYEKWLTIKTVPDSTYPVIFSTLFRDIFAPYLEKNNNIIYTDEIENLASKLQIKMREHPYDRYVNVDYNVVKNFIDSFFEKVIDNYKPILIPAKRILEHEDSISIRDNSLPNGTGVLNQLFYLKNQDLSSDKFILFQDIHKIFKEITGYEFNIVPNAGNSILLRFRINSQWLDANQCGLGLRELLTMISFIYTTKSNVILLEEPENHLHADFQKKFISFLESCKDKQFIIATHSNVFIDNSYVDKIYYSWYDKEIRVSDETSVSKIIDSLGYSIAENLVSDAIILTEGPTDVPLLKRVLALNGVLNKYNVKFWPLGGDIMGSTDLSLFSGLKKVFAIIDTDPGSSKVRNRFIRNCKEAGITCLKLQRYAIENYVPLKVYKAQYQELPKNLLELDDNKNIDEQFGFKVKNKSVKEKNYELALKVTYEDLIGTDLLGYMDSIKIFLDNK